MVGGQSDPDLEAPKSVKRPNKKIKTPQATKTPPTGAATISAAI
jgi:hypothetical protein